MTSGRRGLHLSLYLIMFNILQNSHFATCKAKEKLSVRRDKFNEIIPSRIQV